MTREWRSPPGADPTMRITCPNCEAQYEVDDALIPEGGRDVQCSNCGKGWFQSRPADPEEVESHAAAENVEREATDPEDEPQGDEDAAEHAAPDKDVWPDASAEVPSAPEPAWARTPEAVGRPAAPEDVTKDEGIGEEPPAAPAAKAPPGTDETVLAVLREEAQRELAQRREEASGLESQPDLGLTETSGRRASPAAPDAAAVGGVVGVAGRRELLPDIDAINSTLRSDAERSAALDSDEDEIVEERRRGFRLGFGLMLLIAAALIGLYLGAGAIAEAVPALSPALAAYVELANGFRSWIDGLLAAGVEGLSSLLPPAADA